MASSETFAEFCANLGLKGDAITVLTEAGFERKEELSLLASKDIEELHLQLQQKLFLRKAVVALQEEDATRRVRRKQADEEQTDDEIRIVLLGKTGVGKSASANTILGPEVSHHFTELGGINAQTDQCQRSSVKINGRNIRVIDTPGLLDPNRDKGEIANEVTRCLMMSSPGPHIVLFVLKIKDCFTEQDFLAYDMFRKVFHSHLNRYVVVLFTHGDELENGETIETVLKPAKRAFERDPFKMSEGKNYIKMLLDDVQNKKILFNNKSNQVTKDQQVWELLKLISAMKENNAPMPYFSDNKTQQAAGRLLHMVDEYMKENPGVSRGKAWEEVIKNKIKNRAVMGDFGLPGVALGGKALFVAATMAALTFVPNPVGACITGAVALGAAAVGAVALVEPRQDPCSVM